MERIAYRVTASDAKELGGYRWPADGAAPRGAVVLAHGLGEHSLRYDRVARALAASGLDVVALDHRGHGETAQSEAELGSFGPGGWDALVDDYAAVVRQVREERPERPVVALGHSMGSFVVQTYLLDHSDEVVAAVLSGSAALDELAAILDPSAELELSMLNAPFEPARTDFDWLSRDPDEVDKYVADPRCGFGLAPVDVASVRAGADRTADPAAIGRIRDGFPIYVLAGTADPVNAGLEWLDPLVRRYRDAGLDVTTRYYEEGRHEMFNETNRDEVVAELVAWLDGLPALSGTGRPAG